MLSGGGNRAARAGAVAALAWGGTILGHLLSYVVAYPGQQVRAGHLAGTGHGSFQAVVLTAVGAGAIGIGLTVLRALYPRSSFGFKGLALMLGAIQVPAFVLIESVERGFDLGAAAADPAVLVGLGAQVLLAVLLALGVVALARSVRALFVHRVSARRQAGATALPRPGPFIDLLGFLRARPLRGPPLPLGL